MVHLYNIRICMHVCIYMHQSQRLNSGYSCHNTIVYKLIHTHTRMYIYTHSLSQICTHMYTFSLSLSNIHTHTHIHLDRRQSDSEKAERARQAYEKGAKLREKSNYNDHLELNSLRHTQSISPAYTFSYFRYVPPQTSNGKTGGKAGGGNQKGGRGGQKTKRRKPPEK